MSRQTHRPVLIDGTGIVLVAALDETAIFVVVQGHEVRERQTRRTSRGAAQDSLGTQGGSQHREKNRQSSFPASP